ncbi:hypothetical protein [Methanopyrus sp.]
MGGSSEGPIVVLDDAHVLPGALVVEVRGYVRVGSRTLMEELEDLALDQSNMWRVVDWNQNVRKVRKVLEEKTKFREVYDRLTYELEDWIEEASSSRRSAGPTTSTLRRTCRSSTS